jgi:Na+/H+ antiporter NhaA
MNSDGAPGQELALRACKSLRRMTWMSFKWGLIIGIPFSIIGIGIVVLLAAFCSIIICGLIRILIVAIYFARVSTLQMFGFAVSTGVILTINEMVPEDVRGVPIMVLIGVVLFIFYRISEMDPTGDNLQAAFFIEAVEEQEKRREAERQKAQAAQPPKNPTIP